MIDLDDAKAIIGRHQSDLPVQTVPLAKALGINVYRVSEWPDRLSGMIKKDEARGGESGFAIFVNAEHPETRRRFTIAHELAHYILHENLIGDGISEDALYRSGLSSAIEAQANKLAADILMPWPQINEAMSGGLNSIEELAKRFNVSKSAMSIRLGVPYETSESDSQ